MAVGRFHQMLTEVRHIDDAPSRIRQWNHNTAQFRSSARQAETRYENLLPQGPVCHRAPDSSAPQPPGVRDRSGPTRSAYAFNPPMRFGPVKTGPFLSGASGTTTDDGGLRRSVILVRHLWSDYLIAASVAPKIMRGFSTVPPCTSTAALSTPSPLSVCSGTFHELALPVQSPSLTQRRSTLW